MSFLALRAFIAAVGAAFALPLFLSVAVASTGREPGHLYVADPGNGAIYRYALVRGLPQTTPDEVFARVPDFGYPTSLGVDGAGNIYAAGPSSNYRYGFVRIFAPNGAVVGSLTLHRPITAFAVDSDGYLYVVIYRDPREVLVFGPGARPHQIAVLNGNGNPFSYLATDGAGRLYSAMYQEAYVFDHPRRSSGPSFSIAAPPYQWLGCPSWFSGSLAFDGRSRLYANIGWQCYCQPWCKGQAWHDTDFDAVSDWRASRTDELIYARDCYQRSSGLGPGTVTGMAVFDGYIDAACSGDLTEVLVYRAGTFERQHALETLGGAKFPSDAKVGP